MGNFNSCICPKPQTTATVVGPTGDIRQIELPITAAELMLDEPGHVISPADHILRTCRISALKAEEGLSPGKLYLLVPATRAHSRVTTSETALIHSVRKGRRASTKRRSSRVSPEDGATVVFPEVKATDHRLGVWRPVLEPIFE